MGQERNQVYVTYVVNGEGVKLDNAYVTKVEKYPRPNNVKQLQEFFELINY